MFCDERTVEPATVTSTQAGGSVSPSETPVKATVFKLVRRAVARVSEFPGSITINHESPVNALFLFILKTFKTGFFPLVLAMDLKQPESSVSQQFLCKKRFTQIRFETF